jgi:transcriptional regulator with XRE-family HTH domain
VRIYYREDNVAVSPPPSRWRMIRQLAGLSLNEMSERSGISPHSIGRWERPGSGVVDPQDWHDYAECLMKAVGEQPDRAAAVAQGLGTGGVSRDTETVMHALTSLESMMDAYLSGTHTVSEYHTLAEAIKRTRRRLYQREAILRGKYRKESGQK